MIAEARGRRPVPLEVSDDPRFRRRVIRLALVSSVALGVLFGLAATTLDAPVAIVAAFAAGWLLMPATLVVSLARPWVRYGLVVPASLVSVGLLAVCLGWLPGEPAFALGWILLTLGVALGGGLGLWFWYRLLPVPVALDDPFSAGRWTLIALHVGLVVAGFGLASLALWPA